MAREPLTVSTPRTLPPSAIVSSLLATGVTHVVTVPDFVQLSLHVELQSTGSFEGAPILCCTEDEAVCVAAGLYAAGAVPVVVMQNQGLYACANALRALGLDAGVPVLMLVGQFGREAANYGHSPEDSSRHVVSRLGALMDALDVDKLWVDREADIDALPAFFLKALATSRPAVAVVGVPTAWPGPS